MIEHNAASTDNSQCFCHCNYVDIDNLNSILPHRAVLPRTLP